jgi:hypothetical protein
LSLGGGADKLACPEFHNLAVHLNAETIADHGSAIQHVYRELLRQCIPDLGTPLWLGKTVAGEPFHIERAALGALNLIVGAAGSATAHLAQVLMSRLIEHGLPCIIFDTKGVYAGLCRERAHSSTSEWRAKFELEGRPSNVTVQLFLQKASASSCAQPAKRVKNWYR